MDTACPPPAFGGHMTCGQKPAVDMEGTIYRLYRAQRLYAQLLPKSMLIAILIDNGIRLQSTIALSPEKCFSCRILQDTRVVHVCPFRENSPSTKVACPFLWTYNICALS